jgi:TolB-like protein
MEILAEDLTDEITREVSQNSYIKVITPSRMSAWRGRAVDYSALGRDMDACYLVEGKVQRSGETLRLTAQLIDSATGNMLWTVRFGRSYADIVASPEEFPVAVAAEIGENILQVEMTRALANPGPCTGWDHVLRARSYAARMGTDSTLRQIDEARQAVTALPDLGLAHAVLALALNAQVVADSKELDDTMRQDIRAHARRAAQLDGDNPEVINCLIWVNMTLNEGENSVPLARRLLQLRPHSPTSLFAIATAYFSQGLIADAIVAYTEYDRLPSAANNKLVALYCLGACCFLEGRLEEAVTALDRSLTIYPDFHLALKWKAIVAAARGDNAAAIAVIRRRKEVEPAITLEQAVGQIEQLPILAKLSVKAVAILRQLWVASEGKT